MRMRVLTEADGMALASLCQAWSTMMKAQQKLNETWMLLKTPSGYVQQNPLISIVNSCMETVTRLSREFGLTPASRTRLHVGRRMGLRQRRGNCSTWLNHDDEVSFDNVLRSLQGSDTQPLVMTCTPRRTQARNLGRE